MASLTASGVKVIYSWTEGDVTGKRYTAMQVQLTLSSEGSETNPIPASALGLATIIDSGPFVKSDNSVVLTSCPDYTGVNLLLTDNGTPTDQTGTFQGVVKGWLHQG